MSERYKDEELLRKLYWNDEQSLNDIADQFDVYPSTIQYWMDEFDIERRKPLRDRLPRILKGSDGYNQVWGLDNEGKQRLVYMHRLLAVAEHGLDAIRGKDVHHRNGCKFDNRPDNIELLSRSEHLMWHANEELVNG